MLFKNLMWIQFRSRYPEYLFKLHERVQGLPLPLPCPIPHLVSCKPGILHSPGQEVINHGSRERGPYRNGGAP